MILPPRWIKFKAMLFLALGLLASALLVSDRPSMKTVFLLLIAIWSFCRLYYFAFYVLQRYLDPEFRYAGLISAIRVWIRSGPAALQGRSTTNRE